MKRESRTRSRNASARTPLALSKEEFEMFNSISSADNIRKTARKLPSSSQQSASKKRSAVRPANKSKETEDGLKKSKQLHVVPIVIDEKIPVPTPPLPAAKASIPSVTVPSVSTPSVSQPSAVAPLPTFKLPPPIPPQLKVAPAVSTPPVIAPLKPATPPPAPLPAKEKVEEPADDSLPNHSIVMANAPNIVSKPMPAMNDVDIDDDLGSLNEEPINRYRTRQEREDEVRSRHSYREEEYENADVDRELSRRSRPDHTRINSMTEPPLDEYETQSPAFSSRQSSRRSSEGRGGNRREEPRERYYPYPPYPPPHYPPYVIPPAPPAVVAPVAPQVDIKALVAEAIKSTQSAYLPMMQEMTQQFERALKNQNAMSVDKENRRVSQVEKELEETRNMMRQLVEKEKERDRNLDSKHKEDPDVDASVAAAIIRERNLRDHTLQKLKDQWAGKGKDADSTNKLRAIEDIEQRLREAESSDNKVPSNLRLGKLRPSQVDEVTQLERKAFLVDLEYQKDAKVFHNDTTTTVSIVVDMLQMVVETVQPWGYTLTGFAKDVDELLNDPSVKELFNRIYDDRGTGYSGNPKRSIFLRLVRLFTQNIGSQMQKKRMNDLKKIQQRRLQDAEMKKNPPPPVQQQQQQQQQQAAASHFFKEPAQQQQQQQQQPKLSPGVEADWKQRWQNLTAAPATAAEAPSNAKSQPTAEAPAKGPSPTIAPAKGPSPTIAPAKGPSPTIAPKVPSPTPTPSKVEPKVETKALETKPVETRGGDLDEPSAIQTPFSNPMLVPIISTMGKINDRLNQDKSEGAKMEATMKREAEEVSRKFLTNLDEIEASVATVNPTTGNSSVVL